MDLDLYLCNDDADADEEKWNWRKSFSYLLILTNFFLKLVSKGFWKEWKIVSNSVSGLIGHYLRHIFRDKEVIVF